MADETSGVRSEAHAAREEYLARLEQLAGLKEGPEQARTITCGAGDRCATGTVKE